TSKILFIPHIPKQIEPPINMEVRGEVYCTESAFIHLSEEMERRGLEKPTSQRNIVAGLLGRKENIDLCSQLSFQAFQLLTDDLVFKEEREKLATLQNMGFEIPEFYLNKADKDLEARLEETREFMSNGDYLIDGLVF